MIFLLAAVGAMVFAWLEWRRRDERNRAWRIAAVCVATGALALLGLFTASASPSSPNAETEAVLLTEGAPDDVAAPLRFALPRAGLTNGNVVVVPDVAYVRRQYPDLRHLRVFGNGLEAFELAQLEGVRVSLEGEPTRPLQPAITYLRAPREVTLGAVIKVSGRIAGLNADERVVLSLESPDGMKTEVTAGADSDAFTISAPSPAAEGRFVWRLRMSRADSDGAESLADERIGIAVVKPCAAARACDRRRSAPGDSASATLVCGNGRQLPIAHPRRRRALSIRFDCGRGRRVSRDQSRTARRHRCHVA